MRLHLPAVVLLLVGAAAPPSASAQEGAPDRVVWNGFLSQAYARADDRQILGIPEEGTFGYRNVGLQMRYAMSDKDAFVFQVAHDRLGESPADEGSTDLGLEFAFYQRTLPRDVSLRVGRVKLPIGLWNEVRDVGTLLPFYRPSTTVYLDGSFASEAIDGLVVSRVFGLGRWSLDADVYAGEWDFLESTVDPSDQAAVKAAVGGQLFLETPVEGLRFGVGGWTARVEDFADVPAGGDERWTVLVASAQGTVSRVKVSAELTYATFAPGDYLGGYVLGSVKASDKLTLHLQREVADLDFSATIPGLGTFPIEADYQRGWTAGASWAFRPDLVAKLERHWEKGFGVEDEPFPTLGVDSPARTNYTIASLSVSF